MNILLLCNRTGPGVDARTVSDHLRSFTSYSRHNVCELSFLRDLPAALDLAQFDAIVIHYTVAIGWLRVHYLSTASKERIREFGGLKALFVQDEYRAVKDLHETLRFLGIDVLFTCVPRPEIEKVYPASALPGITKVNTLTGYVADSLLHAPVAPIAGRPIDVGYRTRKYPYWLGRLAYEKWHIGERFAQEAAGSGLILNLSHAEGERLYGGAWVRFVASCKAVLGSESGSSVFDFDGSLQRSVEEYVASHPDASFEEVERKFLANHEGQVRYGQISPRFFEAAALRTAMVLFEGAYSGVLEPWRHYVPLRKDFSNFAEVIAVLRDTRRLQEIANRAYDEVARNPSYSYKAFIDAFDAVMDAESYKHGKRPSARPYSRARYVSQLARSPAYLAQRAYSRVFQWLLLGQGRRGIMLRIWESIPTREREMMRPLVRRLLGR
jgi:hypothetical protein